MARHRRAKPIKQGLPWRAHDGRQLARQAGQQTDRHGRDAGHEREHAIARSAGPFASAARSILKVISVHPRKSVAESTWTSARTGPRHWRLLTARRHAGTAALT